MLNWSHFYLQDNEVQNIYTEAMQINFLLYVKMQMPSALVNKKMKFQARSKSFFLPVSYIEVLK